jgi:hypothetical protein
MDKKQKKRIAGGAATGGGINFQSAVTAIACVFMARGRPLSWLEGVTVDMPIAVEAETGGAGDDIKLSLKSGDTVEVQVKKGLRVGSKLWDSLIKLSVAINQGETDFGVLIVSPTSSNTITEDLSKDIIRLGDGRSNDLSKTAKAFIEKLEAANLPVDSVCRKLRIHTKNAVSGNNADILSAKSELSHLCSDGSQIDQAWEKLNGDAAVLIEQKGRRDVSSTLGLLLASGITLKESNNSAPLLLLEKLSKWTLNTHEYFSVFGINKQLKTDESWIPIEAIVNADAEGNDQTSNLAEALKIYHSWEGRYSSKGKSCINTETLARFIPRVVLIGGPGMGKTTLLKRIARRYSEDSIPVLNVKLAAVAARMRSGFTFEEAVFALGLDGSGISHLEAEQATFPNWLLLCDGLDECGSLQEQIASGVIRFSEGHTKCRLIVTTRPVGYDAAHFDNWQHYNLSPLEFSAAQGHLTNLVCKGASGGAALSSYENADKACSKELSKVKVKEIISRTPLMLGLAASIILKGGSLEETKEALFEQIFQIIDDIPNSRIPEPPSEPTRLRFFLNILGWEVVTNPARCIDEILDCSAKRLSRETGETGLNSRSNADTFLKYWMDVGVIEKVGNGKEETLVFVHKSFGEFAASRYLSSMPIDAQKEAIKSIIKVPECEEIIKFSGLLGLANTICEILMSQGACDKTSMALDLIAFSSPPPECDLRKRIISLSLEVIQSNRRASAFEVGKSLIQAARRFPEEIAPLLVKYLKNEQPWTYLIAWASTLAAGSSYHQNDDLENVLSVVSKMAWPSLRSSLSRGVVLGGDPPREIIDAFILEASSVLLDNNPSAATSSIVLDSLNNPDLHTLGFIDRAQNLVKEKGRDWKIGSLNSRSLISYLRTPEGYKEAQSTAYNTIFDAIGANEELEVDESECNELIYLSAFFDASNFWEMPAYDAWAWREDFDVAATKEVIKGFSLLCGVDIDKLKKDAAIAKYILQNFDESKLWGVTTHVDPPKPDWESTTNLPIDMEKVERALYHPSKWVVFLAANLIESAFSKDDLFFIVQRLLKKGGRHSLWIASALAAELDRSAAIDLIIDRLAKPLVPGCKYLFKLLQKLDFDKNDKSLDIIRHGLSGEEDIAQEAAVLANNISEAGDNELLKIIIEAYEYWLESEKPYPVGGGVIPVSPRTTLLKARNKISPLTYQEWRDYVSDSRSDVEELANSFIVSLASESDSTRAEFFNDIDGQVLPGYILTKVIKALSALSKDDIKILSGLLGHGNAKIRYAAMIFLEDESLGASFVKPLAINLTKDDEQEIVDRAYRILDKI